MILMLVTFGYDAPVPSSPATCTSLSLIGEVTPRTASRLRILRPPKSLASSPNKWRFVKVEVQPPSSTQIHPPQFAIIYGLEIYTFPVRQSAPLPQSLSQELVTLQMPVPLAMVTSQ